MRAPVSSASRQCVVIHNPTAGWRRRRYFHRVLRALRALGCGVVVHATHQAGDARRLAAAVRDCDVLVVAGGDGTINEVLNGLSRRDIPLAVIPLGTANVLAWELGMIGGPAAVARAIAHGPVVEGWLGRANGRPFSLMLGAGFDALVVARVNPLVKRWLRQGAFALAGCIAAAGLGKRHYRVEIDGTAYEAASVVVAKGRRYGGRFVLAPAARLLEPEFQVCLFERSGPLAVLGYGFGLLTGRLERQKGFRIVPGNHIRIEAATREPVQADGDLATRLPVEITLDPRPVRYVMAEDTV